MQRFIIFFSWYFLGWCSWLILWEVLLKDQFLLLKTIVVLILLVVILLFQNITRFTYLSFNQYFLLSDILIVIDYNTVRTESSSFHHISFGKLITNNIKERKCCYYLEIYQTVSKNPTETPAN